MALSFTEGSIGGDIERIDLGELQKFYAGKQTVAASRCRDEGAARLQRHRHRAVAHDGRRMRCC